MKTIKASSPHAIEEALAVLRAGGVVVHATETCYGIACDLENPAAVQRLFDIKNRPPDQPVSALFSSIDAARSHVDISPEAEAIVKKYLPGPLTVVLPRTKDALPLWLTAAGDGKDPWIGVRISSHPFAMEFARDFGGPLATTSANLHGKENAYSIADVKKQFQKHSPQPDLLIDSGKLSKCLPSTVVRIAGGRTDILRRGEIIF